MKLLFTLAFSLFLLFTPLKAEAQENWIIDRFDADISILSDGKVRIVETIDLDFGSLQKHGIFRDLPYIYQLNTGQKRYTQLLVKNVAVGSRPVPYKTSKKDNHLRIKIGDPKKLISGKQTYRIKYTVAGVLNSFDTFDELFWNVTGNNWPVTITNSQATVTLPKEGLTKISCFEGAIGSTNPCFSSQINQKQATFKTSKSLLPGRGLTLVVGYTKGLVPIITVSKTQATFGKYLSFGNIALFIISLATGIGVVIWVWWQHGRDFWWKRRYLDDPLTKHEIKPVGSFEPIAVEFEPPKNLRPAEIGTLVDERADTLDVSATIVDLAVRGYLKITEVSKSWKFGKRDYLLTKINKNTSNLLNYEKELYQRLFDEDNTVIISKLKTKFYQDLKKVKEKLYQEMIAKKFFLENPEKTRTKYFLVGLTVVIVSVVMIAFGANQSISLLISFAAGITIGGLLMIIFSSFMPKRTAFGREVYRKARGYELFISTAEKYRQRFFEEKNMFNQILPYAIIFGLTEKFAKALAVMGVEPKQPSWYSGATTFNAMTFSNSIQTFSNSLGSAMASAPKGSGFSTGGGFSGSGFGGGGGGSW